jgi:hypothetical protein
MIDGKKPELTLVTIFETNLQRDISKAAEEFSRKIGIGKMFIVGTKGNMSTAGIEDIFKLKQNEE